MPFYAKDKSKIKMAGMTGPKDENIYWYSPVWQNRKPANEIIAGMLERFKKAPGFAKCKKVLFYENGQLIHEIEIK